MFALIPPEKFSTKISSNPRLAPIDDGSIRFEWVNGNKELFLTVMGNSIESQKWQPLEAIESEDYRVVSLDSVDHELEWLEA